MVTELRDNCLYKFDVRKDNIFAIELWVGRVLGNTDLMYHIIFTYRRGYLYANQCWDGRLIPLTNGGAPVSIEVHNRIYSYLSVYTGKIGFNDRVLNSISFMRGEL